MKDTLTLRAGMIKGLTHLAQWPNERLCLDLQNWKRKQIPFAQPKWKETEGWEAALCTEETSRKVTNLEDAGLLLSIKWTSFGVSCACKQSWESLRDQGTREKWSAWSFSPLKVIIVLHASLFLKRQGILGALLQGLFRFWGWTEPLQCEFIKEIWLDGEAKKYQNRKP